MIFNEMMFESLDTDTIEKIRQACGYTH